MKSKKDILKLALKLRNENKIYDRNDPLAEDIFKGSIERFIVIAEKLQGHTKILDVGAGNGILLSLLSEMGHECYAVDYEDFSDMYPLQYSKIKEVKLCNVEVDDLPYEDEKFDAVTCCQALEHFVHSHLHPVKEMKRVLKPGGILELDVPNVACYRNRSRLLRGKNIGGDYVKSYLHAEPINYKGHTIFPLRHNREFTKKELDILFKEAGFTSFETSFLRSRRYREGTEKFKNILTSLKDAIPSLRKSLIGFAIK